MCVLYWGKQYTAYIGNQAEHDQTQGADVTLSTQTVLLVFRIGIELS